MIRIAVEKRQATVEETELITTGSVGIPVEFGFTSDWDGLSKVAVFRVGDNPDWYDIILDDTGECVIPWEILTTDFEGEPVFIGVEGTDRLTNTVVVPTIWVSVGAVKPGAHSGNAESADPTATQWSQIRMLAEQAASDAESAQEAAETAETYVSHTPIVIDDYWNVWDGEKYVPTAQKAKGDDGEPGQDGQDGFSPVVEVESISGGHTVTITDSTGSDTFNVMDGADGQPGPPGLAVQATAPTTGVLAWLDTDDDSTVTLAETSDLVPIQNTLTQLETTTAQLDQNMAYVESGNTASRPYTGGEFISWKGTLYTANGAISSGQSFSTGTGGNLAAVIDGGLNALNNKMSTLDLLWSGDVHACDDTLTLSESIYRYKFIIVILNVIPSRSPDFDVPYTPFPTNLIQLSTTTCINIDSYAMKCNIALAFFTEKIAKVRSYYKESSQTYTPGIVKIYGSNT